MMEVSSPVIKPHLARSISGQGLRRFGSQAPIFDASFVDIAVNEARKAVLKGNFIGQDTSAWRSPQWKLLVFISSTFTDTGVERNILMSDILPRLRLAGQRVGVEVTFVDMRWGVRDENTLDHRTWLECSRELERCRRDSSGLFFLSLQSHKYGYISLPRSILKTTLDERLASNASTHISELANEWYRLDKNAVPEEYVLKSLTSMTDDSFWRDALPNLTAALDGLNFCKTAAFSNIPPNSVEASTPPNSARCLSPNNRSNDLLIGRSVTEWETKAALACNAARGFWMRREFPGGVNRTKDPLQSYDDTALNHDKKAKLKRLKEWMAQKLPASRIFEYYIPFESYLDSSSSQRSDHVNKWTHDILATLSHSLKEITDRRRAWDLDSCGLGLPGYVLNEMLHHSAWAANKCTSFHGRESLVQAALIELADHKLINALSKIESALRRKGSPRTSQSSPRRSSSPRSNSASQREWRSPPDSPRFSPRSTDKGLWAEAAIDVSSPKKTQSFNFGISLQSPRGAKSARRSLKRQVGLAKISFEGIESDSFQSTDKHLLRTASYPITKSASFGNISEATEEEVEFDDVLEEVLSDDISIASDDSEDDSRYRPWIKLKNKLLLLCQQNASLINLFRELHASLPGTAHPSLRISTDEELEPVPLAQQTPVRSLRSMFAFRLGRNSADTTPKCSPTNESPSTSNSQDGRFRSSRTQRQKFSEIHASTSRRLSGNDKTLQRNGYHGIHLVIMGASGTGKTALMAMLAAELLKHQLQKHRHVIIRFCGTSPGSTNGRSLVQSICHQIEYCHEKPFNPSIQKMSYDEVVAYFHKLVREHAVVLLIDSLDQLSDADLARSDISFLKGIVPHPDSRIVVSTLPDERDPATGNWIYYYGCSSKLEAAGVPRMDVSSFRNTVIPSLVSRLAVHPPSPTSSTIGDDDAMRVMECMLRTRGRTLTDEQWRYVTQQASTETTALYLWLAVRVVDKWSSSSTPGVDVILAPGVKNLIMQIFDDVERSYGRELTRAAFGFITWSVNGVSDAEMEDLLSLDPDVMASVNQYCQDATRLPSHVWLRLRGDIYGLVTEREGGCLSWYHRQLRETAEARYSHSDRMRLQRQLASYYGGIVDEAIVKRTVISTQPLVYNSGADTSIWLPDALINIRRCEEAAAHMIEAKMISEAVRELCNIEGVLARAKVGGGFTLITQLAQLLRSSGGDAIVDHYYRWIRRDIHTILKDPTMNVTLTGGRQPLCSIARRDLVNCMKGYDQPEFIDGSWTRCRLLGGEHDFDPLQSILQAHTETVSCVCYSHDGSKIASASWDKSIRIWDASIGNILCTLEGHTDSVMCVAFNSTGDQLVSSADDNTIRIWDACVGSIIRVLEGHTSCVNSVCFSSNSMLIASGSNDTTVKLWNVLDGSISLSLQQHTNNVSSIAISFDSRYVASGSHDNTIRVWDVVSGDCLHCLSGHTDRVNSVCWSYDNKLIVSGSDDETVRTWDVKSGLVKNVFEGQHDPVPSVCISSDGAMIVSGAWDSTIRLWDSSNGSLYCCLDGHTGTVNSVAMFPNGETIVSGSEDKTVRIWEANVWYSDRTSVVSHSGYVTCVCFSSDSSRVVSGSEDKTIKIWEVANSSVIRTLEGHTADITSVSMNRSGSLVVSASADNSIRIWSVATGAVLCSINNRYDQATVCFTPDGAGVIGGSWGYAIRIWDLNGVVMKSLKGHTGDVSSLCVNSTGSRLLSGSCDNTVVIWDLHSTRSIVSMEGHEMKVNCVSWCKDESLVASASEDMTVRLWSNDGDLISTFSGHKDIVTSVYISVDGKMLVTGSWDFTVRVWDVEDSRELVSLVGHTNRVNSVCISEDGKQIVSGSDDKSILIWDTSTGCLLNRS